MNKYIFPFLILFLSFFAHPLLAKETKQSQKEALELFQKVYNSAFGEQGSSMNYSVNIIGLYKTEGEIVYKGKKIRYSEKRYLAWEDGKTAYMVDKKKKTVGVYEHDDDDKDKYLSKFKYDINNFDISSKSDDTYYYITAKIKNAGYWGIREAMCKVLKKNMHPVSLTIKLAMIRTTVMITNFKSGGIKDEAFVFPRHQFSDYTFTDNRKKDSK